MDSFQDMAQLLRNHQE